MRAAASSSRGGCGAVYGLGATAVLCLVAAIVIFLVYDRRCRPSAARRRSDRLRPSATPTRRRAPTRALLGVDALGDPALIVGGDLRVVAANAAARRLFGERVVADDLRLVLRHPAVLDAVRVAASATAPVEREVTGLGSDNGAYRVRVAALGPDGARDAGERLLVTFIDITQARLTERMRVDFIANASHELRTPVTTLLGFIETLQGPAARTSRRAALPRDHAPRGGADGRLIDDLLSLSRIELDKHVRPQTALDVAPLIADVGRTLAMRLDADQRRLAIRVADGPAGGRRRPRPGAAGSPQSRLERAQVRPVGDGDHRRRRRVSRPAREPMVRVTVGDQGEGIAPEHLPRLTERFYRIDTSRSRSMGGTGLGLAIVKHIIERHRGGFEIVSKPGEGSHVSFTLPLASTETTVTRV